ncbi:MAG: OadG family protein [Clostridia bacterium]|nr:OadG family protein [Clostridia bacterium]
MNVWKMAAAAGSQLIGTADKNGDVWLETGEVVMTVITGITIVFSMLVLLCLIILIFGKIMDAASGKGKKEKTETPKTAPKTVKKEKPTPVAEEGVSPSVVAAIAAAISCILGKGKFTIRKITRSSSRKAWGSTGAAENVRPF